jgi:Fungal fucose-specific lectin
MFCYLRLTIIALQIRIYYIDDKQLHEMCWSSNGTNEGWYRGSLDIALIKVTPKSLLAVNVDDQWLKVYCRGVGGILGCQLGIQGPMRILPHAAISV